MDTSALIAILDGEPDGPAFLRAIAGVDDVFVSAVQAHETGVVLGRRHGPAAIKAFRRFLAVHDIEVVACDREDARAAITAYQCFGKGTGHPAQLSLADCAAYALAIRLGAPLLFKGDDFPHTDVTPALRAA